MKDFRTAWLTTNRSCNNNCSWCYAKNTLSNARMDFEQAKSAVDELKRRNVKKIVLIGGEPTIYPYFCELIRYIHDNGMRVSVASNGKKFSNKEFARRVKEAGVNHIDISIKATDEEAYYRNTGTYGLQDCLAGYRNLKEAGVKVSVSYVVVSDDKKTFDAFVEFLENEGITSVLIQFVKPVLTLKEPEEIMKPDEMGKFVTYIYNRMKDTNIKYGMEVSFPVCLIEPEIWDKLVAERHVSSCCHVPKGTGINFDENFRVIPCNHFAEFPFSDLPIDFSDPDSIDKLYETERVKRFRSLARKYPAEKCKECDKWLICGGGCFTRWLMDNPNNYIK